MEHSILLEPLLLGGFCKVKVAVDDQQYDGPASLCIVTDVKPDLTVKLGTVDKCNTLLEKTWFYTNLAGNPVKVRFLLKT